MRQTATVLGRSTFGFAVLLASNWLALRTITLHWLPYPAPVLRRALTR
jgi:hypothetical protein